MKNDEASPPVLNLTRHGVEFAPWSTAVENDQLFLTRLNYQEAERSVTMLDEELTLSVPPLPEGQRHSLEATFISTDKKAVIRIGFDRVVAFRVLDENGLLELWEASAVTPRPARATFRARGHKWADESLLVFLDRGDKPRFSYFVATDDLCLEVVCSDKPEVVELGPAIVGSA